MSNVAELKRKTETSPKREDGNQTLRGTFVSVMLLGGFIALSWLGVLILYIVRN